MQIGNLIIEPWNKHNAIWRVVALLLVALWAVWGAVIYYESAQTVRQSARRKRGATARGGTLGKSGLLPPRRSATASAAVRRAKRCGRV